MSCCCHTQTRVEALEPFVELLVRSAEERRTAATYAPVCFCILPRPPLLLPHTAYRCSLFSPLATRAFLTPLYCSISLFPQLRPATLSQPSANRLCCRAAHSDSSRSHAVLQLSLRRRKSPSATAEVGRFSFVDLAGTERGNATMNCSDRERRLEGEWGHRMSGIIVLASCCGMSDGCLLDRV